MRIQRYLWLRYICIVAILFFVVHVNLMAQSVTLQRLDGTTIDSHSLDKEVGLLMDAAHVKGLAIAIFNNHQVTYKKAFGIGHDQQKPLHPAMNIYGASLSKNLFAVLVMKLVEEGLLDLDTPLQNYLPKPIYSYPPKTKWHDDYRSLSKDSLHRRITARMCLDHTTGFPNWRWDNPDRELRITLPPGSRYSYSGEGMVYLQTVLEKMTGSSLEELMQEKIFDPLQMKNSAYTWLSRFESAYALGFDKHGKAYQKDKDNEARAASTLETTLDDYAIFLEAVLQDKIITIESRKQMFSPQIRLRSVSQFGPMSRKDSHENDSISLSYGLGWGLLKSPYGWGAFKEGHGDGFQHYCIIFPDSGIGILIMSNSDNAESIFKALLALTIADKYTPWKWQNYIPSTLTDARR